MSHFILFLDESSQSDVLSIWCFVLLSFIPFLYRKTRQDSFQEKKKRKEKPTKDKQETKTFGTSDLICEFSKFQSFVLTLLICIIIKILSSKMCGVSVAFVNPDGGYYL